MVGKIFKVDSPAATSAVTFFMIATFVSKVRESRLCGIESPPQKTISGLILSVISAKRLLRVCVVVSH